MASVLLTDTPALSLAQCLYLRALFVVAAQPGAATMRDGLLGAVVDHLLSLDVEIRWQDIAERPGRVLT